MPLPAAVRRSAGTPPAAALVSLLERLVPARRDGLGVLTLHRVGPLGPEATPGTLSATPESFGALLDALVRRHAFVDVDTVLRRIDGGSALPRRALLVTIDDGYADTAEHAWPALRARGIPAVLFVPTAYPDAPDRTFWWDRLHRAIVASTAPSLALPDGSSFPLTDGASRTRAYRAFRDRLKPMPHEALLAAVDEAVRSLGPEPPASEVLGWAALRGLGAEGLTLAPHSRSHPLLTRIEPAQLSGEIAGSRDDLAAATGSTSPVFAYPSGAVSSSVREAVAAAGLRLAFTTERGVNDLRVADPLTLKRVNVAIGTPGPLIRAQVVR
jgi:peptidoglycan/xylan/chitin deacetylase (PgdA/CDA1 family)